MSEIYLWAKNLLVGILFLNQTNSGRKFFYPKKIGSEIYGLIYDLSELCCCFVCSLFTADLNNTEFVVGGVVVGGLAVATMSSLNLMLC